MTTATQLQNQTGIDTKARFLHLQNQQFFDEGNLPLEGGYVENDGTIINYRNGYVHADSEPAIDCPDCHIEYWRNGRLHRGDYQPAVISDYGMAEEYWLNGERVK